MSNAVQLSFLSALTGNISQKGANALQIAGAGSFDGVLNQSLQSLQPANNLLPPTSFAAGLANPSGSLLPPGDGSNLPVTTASLRVEDIDIDQTLASLEISLGATFAPLDTSSVVSRELLYDTSLQKVLHGGSTEATINAKVVKAQPSTFIGLNSDILNANVQAGTMSKLHAPISDDQMSASAREGLGIGTAALGSTNASVTPRAEAVAANADAAGKASLRAFGETETGSLRSSEKWTTSTSSAVFAAAEGRSPALDATAGSLGSSPITRVISQSTVLGEQPTPSSVLSKGPSNTQESLSIPHEQQLLARRSTLGAAGDAVIASGRATGSFELNVGTSEALVHARIGRQSSGIEADTLVAKPIEPDVMRTLGRGSKDALAAASSPNPLSNLTNAMSSSVDSAKLLSNGSIINDAAKELSNAASVPIADPTSRQSPSVSNTTNLVQATPVQPTSHALNFSNQVTVAPSILGQFSPNARTASFNADGMLSKMSDVRFIDSAARSTEASSVAELPDRPVTAPFATSGQNSGFSAAVSSTMSASFALNMGDASNPASNTVPQLGQRIQWMMTNAAQVAEIRVDPPELGSLQIQVSSDEKQTSVSFLTQTSAARELIEASLPRLREHLESMGIELGDTSVEQQDSDEQSMPESPQQTADRAPGTGSDTAIDNSSVGKTPERDGGIDAYA
ncbi:MAG: flagellar hook-length control protein FliK [Pseudomonadales bacterium]